MAEQTDELREGKEGEGVSEAPAQQAERVSLAERGRKLVDETRAALRRPSVGASVAGVSVLAAGAIWGVTEALVASGAAYVVFRTLKRHARKAEAHRRHHEPAPSTAG